MTISIGTLIGIHIAVITFYVVCKYFFCKKTCPSKFSHLFDVFVCLAVAILITVSGVNNELRPSGGGVWLIILSFLCIFGIVAFLINLYPPALIPFSNTFGYAIVKCAGIDNALDELINPPESVDNDTVEKLYKIISKKPMILINILTPGNFNEVTKTFGGKNEPLRKLIFLKDIVSSGIWYFLAGCLVFSITTNILLDKSFLSPPPPAPTTTSDE